MISGDRATVRYKGEDRQSTIVRDPTQTPKAIDHKTPKGGTILGIYKLENDTLTLCYARVDEMRPKDFDGKRLLFVLMREKKPG